MASLADPRRTDGSAADALIRDLPAVVWLGYGIHGDEISSTDAALYTAYHLLAARDDELVRTALESARGRHRPVAEPRRPRPLRALQPRRGRQRAVVEPGGGRARPALARRPQQPLPVRPQPRPHRADAARDPRARARAARVVSAGRGRRPRDGRRVDLLLSAQRRAVESAHHRGAAVRARAVRPQQRALVRSLRLRVLHARDVRLLLSRLRRHLGDLPGRRRHDLRAGVGAGAGGAPARSARCSATATACGATSRRRSPPSRPRPRTASDCCATSGATVRARSRRGAAAPCASTCCRGAATPRGSPSSPASWSTRASRSAARRARSPRASRSSRPAASSSPRRSRRDASRAPCSRPAPTCRSSSCANRSGAAARACRTRCTTSPPGRCRCCSVSSRWRAARRWRRDRSSR